MMETEESHFLPFLDVLVKGKPNSLLRQFTETPHIQIYTCMPVLAINQHKKMLLFPHSFNGPRPYVTQKVSMENPTSQDDFHIEWL
jgi:hypothetical protein